MRLVLLIGLLVLNVSLGQSQHFNRIEKRALRVLAKHITGVYNNQEQADTTQNPLLRLSEIRAFRIWTHRKKDYWFSIGWYQPGVPEQPMGEKIFHVKAYEDGKFLVDCYSWKDMNAEGMRLQWRKRRPYKAQTISDLTEDGCTNYLTIEGDGRYVLKTQDGEICAFSNPMAPFDGLYFHFVYDEEGQKMDIYDKNYKGDQVIFHYMDTPMCMRKLK